MRASYNRFSSEDAIISYDAPFKNVRNLEIPNIYIDILVSFNWIPDPFIS